MEPKPVHLGAAYAAQFRDRSIADAYPTRPPYPPELFHALMALVCDEPRVALDVGCGTGDVARLLAPHMERVDAIDPSPAMLARGHALPGGDHPHLRWVRASGEEFDYPGPYALVVAAESLHWMEWDVVLRRIRRALSTRGHLAIVLNRGFIDKPWAADLDRLIRTYATNREYAPYDLLQELASRGLFAPEGRLRTAPIPFAQPIGDYIESFHSRNGFSRDRMGEHAAEFDARLAALVQPYADGDMLSFQLVADVAWGRPTA